MTAKGHSMTPTNDMEDDPFAFDVSNSESYVQRPASRRRPLSSILDRTERAGSRNPSRNSTGNLMTTSCPHAPQTSSDPDDPFAFSVAEETQRRHGAVTNRSASVRLDLGTRRVSSPQSSGPSPADPERSVGGKAHRACELEKPARPRKRKRSLFGSLRTGSDDPRANDHRPSASKSGPLSSSRDVVLRRAETGPEHCAVVASHTHCEQPTVKPVGPAISPSRVYNSENDELSLNRRGSLHVENGTHKPATSPAPPSVPADSVPADSVPADSIPADSARPVSSAVENSLETERLPTPESVPSRQPAAVRPSVSKALTARPAELQEAKNEVSEAGAAVPPDHLVQKSSAGEMRDSATLPGAAINAKCAPAQSVSLEKPGLSPGLSKARKDGKEGDNELGDHVYTVAMPPNQAQHASVEPCARASPHGSSLVPHSILRSALRRPRSSDAVAVRRVTFDSAVGPTQKVEAAGEHLPTAYSRHSRFRNAPRSRRRGPTTRNTENAGTNAVPINISDSFSNASSPEERALVDQLQYVLDGIVGAARAGGGKRRSAKTNDRGIFSHGDGPSEENDSCVDTVLFESLGELAVVFQQMACKGTQRNTLARTSGIVRRKTAGFDRGSPGEIECGDDLSAGRGDDIEWLGTAQEKSVPQGSKPSMLLRLCSDGSRILSSVVARLLALRSRSTLVALLVGSIMLILAQSDACERLFGKPEIAALVDAFFQSLPCLVDRQGESVEGGRDATSVALVRQEARVPRKRRRRGKLARRGDNRGEDGDSTEEFALQKLRMLLSESCGVEDPIVQSIQESSLSVAAIFGLALAAVLEVSDCARVAMVQSRRVHKIVAIFRQAQAGCVGEVHASRRKLLTPIVTVALRVLEFATLHSDCQVLVTRETPILKTVVSVLRSQRHDAKFPCIDHSSPSTSANCVVEKAIGSESQTSPGLPRSKKSGTSVGESVSLCPLHDEATLSHALKLCVNLIHDCEPGLVQFLECGGVSVVLNLLALPSVWPRGDYITEFNNSQENFDVRVLSVALLASAASKSKQVCSLFHRLQPTGTGDREGGATAFVLELLKAVGESRAKVENAVDTGQGVSSETVVRVKGPATQVSAFPNENHMEKEAREAREAKEMELRIVAGYLCLLLGALARGCLDNRNLILSAMPENSLDPIADVLDEFLGFHHDVGVNAPGVDDMYTSIICALREEQEVGLDISGASGRAPDAENCKDSSTPVDDVVYCEESVK